MKLSRFALVVATTAISSAVLVAPGVAPATAATTATTSITGQATYTCQAKVDGSGQREDPFSVQLQLNVPAQVHPGDKVSLRGTLAVQFPESTRQASKLMGVTQTEMLSDNIAVVKTVGGRSDRLVAYRWDSGPQPLRDPMVVYAPVAFPPITVPQGATGTLDLQLMQNGAVANPVSGSPAKVAWSGEATATGPMGTHHVKAACWLPGKNAAVIGRIPIARQAAAAPLPGTSGTPGTQAPNVSTGAPGSGQALPPGGVPTTSGVASNGGVIPSGPGTTVGGQAQQPAAAAGYITQASPTDPNGIYVKSNVLIFLGFAVCLISLCFGSLTGFRLRSLRKSMDG